MDCHKYFQRHKSKKTIPTSRDQIWHKYVWERQTLSDLTCEYNRSNKWLRKQIFGIKVRRPKINPCTVVVEADKTFFNRREGLCLFHAPALKRTIAYAFIETETASIYRRLRETIQGFGFTLLAAVVDGRKGIKEVFDDVPVQMCQFHQLMILRRYLTMNPRLEAGRELREISRDLCKVERLEFEQRFIKWNEKWDDFLKEKTVIEDVKWHYTHKRLRSARRSLMTNLPYLFSYQDYPELSIPNTINYAESFNARLKELLRVHRGFSRPLKRKIISEILAI
ncbi:MAG: hypothetical protein WC703_01090 [Candidatus Neomarinimicrobiota bacterium]